MEGAKYYKAKISDIHAEVFYKANETDCIGICAFKNGKFSIDNYIHCSGFKTNKDSTEHEFNQVFVKAMISLGFADAYKLIIPTLENAVAEYVKTKKK